MRLRCVIVKGHFKKRGESWYFWAELEPDADGKRRQKSKGGFKTRREAERAFAEFRNQVRSGLYVDTWKGTVGEFLTDQWLPAITASVRPTTLDHYSGLIRSYVVPAI